MSLRAAVSTFTIVPVGRAELRAGDGVRVLLWLPPIGAVLGALSGLIYAAAVSMNDHAVLLAALLAVGTLALLTRGLHLDGLADTADGLGSRAPAERALEIMRRSDIGPFGVVSVVLVIGIDAAALTVFDNKWHVLAALAVAAATGRAAVLDQATMRTPPARVDGFGALFAGTLPGSLAVVNSLLLLGAAAGLGAACGANPLVWVGVVAAALVVCAGFRAHTTRRFGGVTGDVFGALIEMGTAVTLVGLALLN